MSAPYQKPNKSKISNVHLHFVIWTLVCMTLILSLLVSKKITFISNLKASLNKQVESIAPKIDTTKGNYQTAVLSLKMASESASLTKFTTNQEYTAQINVKATDKRLVGVDAYLFYDPEKIQIVSVTRGDMFSVYPSADFNPKTGKITLSGLAPIGEIFDEGSAVLGTIKFIVLQPGEHTISFDFSLNETDDSNVIENDTARDLLGKTENLSLTVEQ